MNIVNRGIAVIKPKEPFREWAMGVPDPPESLNLEDLRHDCQAVLIPEFESDEAGRALIEQYSSVFFRLELESWTTDESQWPEDTSYEVFLEWFDVELHSVVLDLMKSEIEVEQF